MTTNRIYISMAQAAIAASAIAITALIMLHILSPEFDPSWHMISEYAYGKFGLILAMFFLCWGISSWCAAIALLPLMKNIWGKIGIFPLVLSGLGEIMGALFDIRHSLHGAAFGLGVPTLPVAAVIISIYFVRTYKIDRIKLLLSANLTWISVALLAGSMAIFISSLKSVGAFHPEAGILTSLPAGVSSFAGYANRLLILAYLAWLIVMSNAAIKVHKQRLKR
jgi:hypothetical protein